MKRKKPEPVITTNDLSSAIEAARIAIEGDLPQREDGYTPKDGWFTAKEYCDEIKRTHKIVRFPGNISRDLNKKVEEGEFEGQEVRGWDITEKRRIATTVYRVKKETPNAKPVDRLRRHIL